MSATMDAPELILGTVQFGQAYGVDRPPAPTDEDEVRRILERAFEAGIQLLDTAPVYGGAEALLGRLPAAEPFGIITKVPASGRETIGEQDATLVDESLRASLERLRCGAVEALLFHDSNDLLRPGGERLWDEAVVAQARGRTRRLGVSVYEPDQLQAVLEQYPVELVQLPLNAYDGRFAQSGLLDALHARGIAVHARSVFLQGTLLLPPAALPAWLGALQQTQAALHGWAQEMESDPITVSLAAVCAQPGIDALVVGCRSLVELEGVLASYDTALRKPELGREALVRFRLHDEPLLDPRNWPQ